MNKKRVLLMLFLLSTLYAAAEETGGGVVNYNLHYAALGKMCEFLLAMMIYVGYLLYAIAAIFSVYSACVIYIKMNTGEDGIIKNIMMLVGAALFLIGSFIVFPGFFGYRQWSGTALF